MNFSINNFCRPNPSFTALKFTRDYNLYKVFNDDELIALQEIADEQSDFKHVDVEVGKFTKEESYRPYLPHSSNPFDVFVNTRGEMAYTNIHDAKAYGNYVKIDCDKYEKGFSKRIDAYSEVGYETPDEESAKNFAHNINNADNQIAKAKVLAELIETSNNIESN